MRRTTWTWRGRWRPRGAPGPDAGSRARASLRPLRAAAHARRAREIAQHLGRRIPRHAAIGDALPVYETPRVAELLAAPDEEALEHHAYDAAFAGLQLLRDGAGDERLALVILTAVVVARVDHHASADPSVLQHPEDALHVLAGVVRTGPAAAEDDVAVRVAAREDDARETLLGHAKEDVTMRRRA